MAQVERRMIQGEFQKLVRPPLDSPNKKLRPFHGLNLIGNEVTAICAKLFPEHSGRLGIYRHSSNPKLVKSGWNRVN